jgi:DNA replication and repair protein RecF
LVNVRCHRQRAFTIEPTTVLIGPNGSGKTAVLEALSILSLGRSWRTDTLTDIITSDEQVLRITLNETEREVGFQQQPVQKRLKLHGKAVSLQRWVGSFPTVLFQPDDGQFITGSPSQRRAALDRLLCQAVPGYIVLPQQLHRLTSQRNACLRRIAEGEGSSEELDIWDAELFAVVNQIESIRSEWLEQLLPEVTQHFLTLVPDAIILELRYKSSPASTLPGESYFEYLHRNRQRDIAAGVTLAGPHRADILFSTNTHPAAEYLSRGQQRALVVAWKLAEVAVLHRATAIQPLVLFDDVFAELDEIRRGVITRLLAEYPVVLTATDMPEMATDAHVITLK